MTQAPALSYRPFILFLGLAAALLLVERMVVLLPDFQTQAALPAAVTFDLVVGLPALFYWQMVRRYRLPLATMAAAFGSALALGYALIPEPHQQYLQWASYGLGAVEVGLVVLAGLNLRRIVQAYQVAAQKSADFLENLAIAFSAVLGYTLGPLVSEVALFRYALLSYWARVECQAGQMAFSSHRDSGFQALIGAACFLSVIETGAVHLLLHRWNPGTAWLFLALDLYTLLFLLAHLQAVRLRPTVLTAEQLVVRVGFMWRASLAPERIASIQRISDVPPAHSGLLNLAKPLVTPPNLLITFAALETVVGMYGMRRTVRQVALYVDDPVGLLQALTSSGGSR